MEAVARKLDPEGEVRAFLDDYFAAVRAADLDRVVAHYAPDIVAYDAIGALEFSGLDAYRAHWKACLEMCQHMVFEPRAPVVAVRDDLAFAHCLVRCGGTGPDGKENSGWIRTTFAARKTNGRWRIVHEHYSAPFDPATSKVITDLAP